MAQPFQQPSHAPLIIGVSALIGCGFAYLGFPAFAIIWLGFVVAAYLEPPVILTGKKDQYGSPTPLHDGESKRLRSFAFWRELRTSLIVPNASWLPGWPILGSFIGAVVAALIGWSLPVMFVQLQPVNAVCGFIVISAVMSARRKTMADGDVYGGARLNTLDDYLKENRPIAVISVLLGIVVAVLVATKVPQWQETSAKQVLTDQKTGEVVPHSATTMPPPQTTEAGSPPTIEYVIPTVDITPDPKATATKNPDLIVSGLVDYGTRSIIPLTIAGFFIGFFALTARPWSKRSIEHWKEVVAARAEWQPRWRAAGLKDDTFPWLVERERVGQFQVDTFIADPSLAAQTIIDTKANAIRPTIGAGMNMVALSTPDARNGEPVPGTVHLRRFQIVVWDGDLTDFSDPDADMDELTLSARIGFAEACDASGMLRSEIVEITPMHDLSPVPSDEDEDDEGDDLPAIPDITPQKNYGAVWAVQTTMGGATRTFRENSRGAIAGRFGVDCIIDDRRPDLNGVLFLGTLLEDGVTGRDVPERFTMPSPDREPNWPSMFRHIDMEDHYRTTWQQFLPQPEMYPTPHWDLEMDREIITKKGKSVVHGLAFVCRQGVPPNTFTNAKTEKNLATTWEAPLMVNMNSFRHNIGTGQSAKRQDIVSHAQAIFLSWSTDHIPSSIVNLPLQVQGNSPGSTSVKYSASVPSEPIIWVIQHYVNKAFDQVKKPRPDVMTAKCLTRKDSPEALWEIELKVVGGETIETLRSATERLRVAFQVPWCLVTTWESGVTIFVGGDPFNPKTNLVNPDRDAARLKGYSWEQAFISCGISGSDGVMPKLQDYKLLPSNNDIEVLKFSLPPGISPTTFKEKKDKLSTAKGYTYIEIVDSADPKVLEMMVCAEDPTPTAVMIGPAELDIIENSSGVPFATNILGEVVAYDPKESPHLLLAGSSGGGKSVLAQVLLYGALKRGWDIYVMDPMKGAADFSFTKDYALGFCTTYFEAAGTLMHIYENVVRARVALNGQYGASSFMDLPEEVRPNRVLIFIDEFTSLLQMDAVPKGDDPDTIQEAEIMSERNEARRAISSMVGKIVREARSAGVTIAIGAQAMKSDFLKTLPGGAGMKDSMARILMGNASHGERASALRMGHKAQAMPTAIIPKGRGWWESSTAGSASVIQVWFATQSTYAAALEGMPLADPDRIIDQEQFSEPVVHSFMQEAEEGTSFTDGVFVEDDDEVIELGSFQGFTIPDAPDDERVAPFVIETVDDDDEGFSSFDDLPEIVVDEPVRPAVVTVGFAGEAGDVQIQSIDEFLAWLDTAVGSDVVVNVASDQADELVGTVEAIFGPGMVSFVVTEPEPEPEPEPVRRVSPSRMTWGAEIGNGGFDDDDFLS